MYLAHGYGDSSNTAGNTYLMQGWEDTHGYGYMALGCSVTNNRAGAYVGPFHRWQNLHLTIIWGFFPSLRLSLKGSLPAKQLTYIRQADPFHSDSNIRCRRGEGGRIVGYICTYLRIIDGKEGLSLWWQKWVDSREGLESDLARGACSPRHSSTVRLWKNIRKRFPVGTVRSFWFRGEKRKKIWRNLK